MVDVRELLACPACGGTLASDWSCGDCGARFQAPDGIPNLRLPGDERTEVVRRFYESAPFPGYPPRDSLQGLRARAERNVFARLIDPENLVQDVFVSVALAIAISLAL